MVPESTDPQVANDVRDRTRTARTRSRGKIVLGVLLVPALVALAVSLAAASYGERGAFAGPGSGDGELDTPQRAAVDLGSGHLFVADSGNDRIQVFEPQDGSGSYLAQFTDPAIDAPLGVAVDQADGSIYVSDADDVVKFDSAYAFDGSFTSPGATGPLAVDPTDGDLLVADQATNTVRRFDSDGTPDGAPAIDGSTSPSGAFTGLLDVAILHRSLADNETEYWGP